MREQQLRIKTEPRIDWFTILIDLNRLGLPTATVATTIGIPRPTVLGWKQGAEPRHADGERLLDLWLRMTQRERDQVPMTHCPAYLDR